MKPNDVVIPGQAADRDMEPQSISQDVLLEKYAKDGEQSIQDIRRRVARALANNEAPEMREEWGRLFVWAQEQGFIPGGRICSAAGTGLKATLINCFVQPIDDCISGGVGVVGIYDALKDSAETMRRGGGVGYDFSRIRPRGAWVSGTQSHASGPVSYMEVFDRSCQTVESAGARRGAQMAVLRCDHPDVEAFVSAKDGGALSNFNLSIGVTDAFMRAVERGDSWSLVHACEPGPDLREAGAYRRDDGVWVYRHIDARNLWQQIMRSTYDHAEPGVVFLDTVNSDNALGYCEEITATNPCGEVPLPNFGCCCLGSLNLTCFVRDAFEEHASFDFARFREVVQVAVRMLDNVLDVTAWPLPEQQAEAQSKRRVGLGFVGLGDALAMLGLRYDSDDGREIAQVIATRLRDAAYWTSVELATEKGAFPLFAAEKYLAAPGFASRLPTELRLAIGAHGIRNSHLLAIAPTGTISLAFADNASNGIEPPFSWAYTRKKRLADGTWRHYVVEDHAARMYRHQKGVPDDVTLLSYEEPGGLAVPPGEVFVDESGRRVAMLPPAFVSALEISAIDHLRMIAAVQPVVDQAISKTVNVPADYPYEDFEQLYVEAWKRGVKGVTTYRPNTVLGSVLEPLSVESGGGAREDVSLDADRRIRLEAAPTPPLASLRWPGRPELPNGNPCWTYSVSHPMGDFAVVVGHIEGAIPTPFEVWINGSEQPRGLGAVAKTLSMDMRAADSAWLDKKLAVLEKACADDAFHLAMPPSGAPVLVPSLVAGVAKLIRHRCTELGTFAGSDLAATPVIDALITKREPKAGPDGTMSWTVDVVNATTGDDFVLFLKELVMPSSQRRPYSVWLSGEYPRSLDGLCKLLSLDMRVVDPGWIGMKLRKLLDYPELNGAFHARVPGSERTQSWPSTVAYIARLIIHRFAMLGILSEEGVPLSDAGLLGHPREPVPNAQAIRLPRGRRCGECHNATLIRQDGCDRCTACGFIGACG